MMKINMSIARKLVFFVSFMCLMGYQFLQFREHAESDLGGLGVWEALRSYWAIYTLPDSGRHILDEPFRKVAARAVFIPDGTSSGFDINWGRLVSATLGGTKLRLCELADITHAEFDQIYGSWQIKCLPTSKGNKTDCGRWLRRPTCRSFGVHSSIWANKKKRDKMIAALRYPCGYFRNDQSFLGSAGTSRNTQNNQNELMIWAGCTGVMPVVTEIIISEYLYIDGKIINKYKLTPNNIIEIKS